MFKIWEQQNLYSKEVNLQLTQFNASSLKNDITKYNKKTEFVTRLELYRIARETAAQ